jgi:hypothetical protein
MATTEPYFSLVKTGASSWSAVLVQSDKTNASARPERKHSLPAAHASHVWAERFPRLALALVALTIFAASVTAEIEYLRQTGHLFR